MILVVGSTGRLGSEICRRLALKGIPMRAFTRPTSDSSKVEQLKNYGSEIVVGDLQNPFSLAEACQGMDGVICTASALNSYKSYENDFLSVDLDGNLSLVDRAMEARIPHFIFVSLSSNIDRDSPLTMAKRIVEKRIQESGMVYTILRPALLMETWFSPAVGFDPIAGRATVYGNGDLPIRWISYKDVARTAVNSLSDPTAFDAVLELNGPQALSQREVIRIFEEINHKSFKVTSIPENILNERLIQESEPYEQVWNNLYLCCAHGDQADIVRSSGCIHNTPITIESYFKSDFFSPMVFKIP